MASSARPDPFKACHAVAVPYPGRGHINPMMNLCKLLTMSEPTLTITFVVTEEWLGYIGSEDRPPNIRFSTIPNVLPSEQNRAADTTGFMEAVQTKMEEPFEQLLDRLDDSVPVDIIIADTFLYWPVQLGNRRNIPVAYLWPMSAAVFSISYHFDLLKRNGHFPFELSERGEELVDYIPGISSIRLADLPATGHRKDERLPNLVFRAFANVLKAQYLLFTSILELESHAIHALQQLISIPIYSTGPLIPHFNLDAPNFTVTSQNDSSSHLEWLSSYPPSSVLYLSLGSFLSISSAQMDEIAHGLIDSGITFLWVAREETNKLQEKCGSAGLVVPWCEQLKVLNHSSVGGFWTHCGWSSTMESIFAGVPMITLPILADQTTTSKYIVEDWKIGWDAKREVGSGQSLMRSKDIAKMVQRFMDLESAERKEMTRRVTELQEITHRAIADGGSSRTNLTSFLDDIKRE